MSTHHPATSTCHGHRWHLVRHPLVAHVRELLLRFRAHGVPRFAALRERCFVLPGAAVPLIGIVLHIGFVQSKQLSLMLNRSVIVGGCRFNAGPTTCDGTLQHAPAGIAKASVRLGGPSSHTELTEMPHSLIPFTRSVRFQAAVLIAYGVCHACYVCFAAAAGPRRRKGKVQVGGLDAR